jgi:hypothetical protein
MSGKNADCPNCAISIMVPSVLISPPVVSYVKQKTPEKKQSFTTVVLLIALIGSCFSYIGYKLWPEKKSHADTYGSSQWGTVIDTQQQKQNPIEIDGYDQDLIDAGFTEAQIQKNQSMARVHGVPWTEYKKGLLQTQHYLRFPDERVKDMERSRNQEIQRSRERAGLE